MNRLIGYCPEDSSRERNMLKGFLATFEGKLLNPCRARSHTIRREPPQDVLRDAGDVVLVVVVGEARYPGYGADTEHRPLVRPLEVDHVGPHAFVHGPSLLGVRHV